MRNVIIALLALLVTACAGTPEEQKVKRDLAFALAIERVDMFNQMGIDPVQLDEKELLAIDTLCLVIPIAAIELNADPELIKTLMAACVVIRKAAAKYDPPVVEAAPMVLPLPNSAPDTAPTPVPAPVN